MVKAGGQNEQNRSHSPVNLASVLPLMKPWLSTCCHCWLFLFLFAIVCQLIDQKCGGKVAVVEILMNSLLSRLVDSSHVVRKFCIRGLGNISSVEDSQVEYMVRFLYTFFARWTRNTPEGTCFCWVWFKRQYLVVVSSNQKSLCSSNISMFRTVL